MSDDEFFLLSGQGIRPIVFVYPSLVAVNLREGKMCVFSKAFLVWPDGGLWPTGGLETWSPAINWLSPLRTTGCCLVPSVQQLDQRLNQDLSRTTETPSGVSRRDHNSKKVIQLMEELRCKRGQSGDPEFSHGGGRVPRSRVWGHLTKDGTRGLCRGRLSQKGSEPVRDKPPKQRGRSAQLLPSILLLIPHHGAHMCQTEQEAS